MAFEVKNLEPLIRKILSAPDVDMSSVTAADVRKQLVEMDDSISADDLKAHKSEVKELITGIFHSINNAQDAASKKREHDSNSDEDGENSEEEPPKPPPKKAKKAKASKHDNEDDAEVARKLSKEINGNGSRATRKAAAKKSTTAKKPKKKSAETVESGDEEGAPKKRAARGGFAKEFALSAPLAAVVGTDTLARTQVVKKLWEYIKGNNLQNPQNKKEILCDDKMRAVFSTKKIDMFQMTKAIGEHLHEKSES